MAEPYEPDPRARQHNELVHFSMALMNATPHVFITQLLVACNVAVFLLMVASGTHFFMPTIDSLIRWGANFGPKTLGGQWWRLLSCTFIHIGIIHIAINMWVLWDVGRLVERLAGNFGMLLLYLLSGVFGSLASVWWNPQVVSAGASGAVFGMFGVLLGFAAGGRHRVPAVVAKDLRTSGLTFLVYNLIFGLSVPGIDNAAHLGGFATGLVGGLLVSQPLEGDMRLKRLVRNVLVLLVGFSLLSLANYLMPEPPLDVRAAMDKVAEQERETLQRYRQLIEAARDGKLDDRQLADQLEQQVVTPWRQLEQQAAKIAEADNIHADYVSQVQQYLRLRRQSCEALVESLRTGDAQRRAEHLRLWQLAENLVQQLNQEQ